MHRVATHCVRGRHVSQHYFSKDNTEHISDLSNKWESLVRRPVKIADNKGEDQCFPHQLHYCLSPLTLISWTLTEQHEGRMCFNGLLCWSNCSFYNINKGDEESTQLPLLLSVPVHSRGGSFPNWTCLVSQVCRCSVSQVRANPSLL